MSDHLAATTAAGDQADDAPDEPPTAEEQCDAAMQTLGNALQALREASGRLSLAETYLRRFGESRQEYDRRWVWLDAYTLDNTRDAIDEVIQHVTSARDEMQHSRGE